MKKLKIERLSDRGAFRNEIESAVAFDCLGGLVYSCIWSDLGLVLRPELRGRCGTRTM